MLSGFWPFYCVVFASSSFEFSSGLTKLPFYCKQQIVAIMRLELQLIFSCQSLKDALYFTSYKYSHFWMYLFYQLFYFHCTIQNQSIALFTSTPTLVCTYLMPLFPSVSPLLCLFDSPWQQGQWHCPVIVLTACVPVGWRRVMRVFHYRRDGWVRLADADRQQMCKVGGDL